jgi:hypothetical protein
MGFVLDVADYGARPAPLRSDVQRRLPRLVSGMLASCGTTLGSVEHEWTGDGVNVVLPSDTDPTIALPVLLRTLAALLGEDNARSMDRMRLRMSVGIGLVENSAAGFGGPMIIELSRLVGSTPLRAALTAYPDAHLAVALSEQAHSAIVRPGYPGIPGTQFTRAEVAEKEFRAPAWIWISTRQWTTPPFGPLRAGEPRRVRGSGTRRYRLTARLGAGRASTAYLGTSPEGATVAVKVFRPDSVGGTEARHRLATGIKAAADVRGPRTIRITDSDAYAAHPWIAMPLVPGPSLEAAVEQTGPLPSRTALWLAAGMARGLLDIHMAGLVHGSLRPSNVLLSPDGPVLTDYGTGWTVITDARAAKDSGDAAGTGTEADLKGTADDDIHALGCVAFFAATGRTPYGEGTASGDQLPLDPGDPDLSGCPPRLLPIITACLLPPRGRPSAKALLARLEDAAGPAPLNWLPPEVATRFTDYQFLPRPRRLRLAGRGWRPRVARLLSRLPGHR